MPERWDVVLQRVKRVTTIRERLRDHVNPVDQIQRPKGMGRREYQKDLRLLRQAEQRMEASLGGYFGDLFKKERTEQ